MMSPCGRSFSAWRRFTITPEPVETGSTWMPVSLPKAAEDEIVQRAVVRRVDDELLLRFGGADPRQERGAEGKDREPQ